MSFQATDCVLIMGRRRSGKTHLCKRIQEIWPRRIVIDTMGEYAPGPDTRFCFSFTEFADEILRLERENPEKFVLVVQFDPEADGNHVEFDHMLRLTYYLGNVLLVIEEVHMHATVHQMPKWLRNCLLIGRHQHLGLMFTSQRPGEIHKTIVSQCRHIFCGSIHEGNDLRYVSSFLNEKAERLSTLPERRFIWFRDGISTEISNDFSDAPKN